MKRLAAWLSALALLPSLAACTARREEATGPDIALIVLDTVRRDRLGVYGHERATSPNLDALAREGRLYTRAYSTSSWTAPSHASLFTGLYPVAHGVTQERWSLPEELTTLAERLDTAGYETVGVSGNAMLTRKSGFAQGFTLFEETWRNAPKTGRDAATATWTEDFLTRRTADRPLFLFVNLIGAHAPYDSCGEHCGAFGTHPDDGPVDSHWRAHYRSGSRLSPETRQHLENLYDAEIAEVDHQLGRILRALDAHLDARASLVVVTSDHGEHLGERNRVNHVFSLHEPLIRIPLVVRHPPLVEAGSEDDRPVQLLDLHPTILEAAGLSLPEGEQGRSLFAPQPGGSPRPILTEYYVPMQALRRVLASAPPEERERLERHLRRLRTLTEDGWKLHWASRGPLELYHVEVDPEERENRIDDPDAAAHEERLAARLEALLAELAKGASDTDAQGVPDLDDETRAELRAMGYLED